MIVKFVVAGLVSITKLQNYSITQLRHRVADVQVESKPMSLSRISVLAGCLTALGASASATDSYQAQLRNGFSIRHQHRELLSGVTRLYLSAGRESYIDVPSADIVGFEREESLPPKAAGDAAPGGEVEDAAQTRAVYAPSAHRAGRPDRSLDTRKRRLAQDDNLRPAVGAGIDAVIHQASDRHGIDADLIGSVINAESGFRRKAVSAKGARGLMQLMPSTASRLGVTDSFDVGANVDGGARYLRELLARYHNHMIQALAAYNAGPGRVSQYGGVPPYRETRVYIARVVREFNRRKMAERKASSEYLVPGTK